MCENTDSIPSLCIFSARLLRSVSCLCEEVSKLLLLLTCLFSDMVESLQHNVTQAIHQNITCYNLKAAADSMVLAARSQNEACKAKELFLENQL